MYIRSEVSIHCILGEIVTAHRYAELAVFVTFMEMFLLMSRCNRRDRGLYCYGLLASIFSSKYMYRIRVPGQPRTVRESVSCVGKACINDYMGGKEALKHIYIFYAYD